MKLKSTGGETTDFAYFCAVIQRPMKEKYFTFSTIENISREIKSLALPYARNKSIPLQTGNCILLVLDMQKYFVSENSPAFIPSSKSIVPGINELINVCERKDIPVIFTRHLNNEADARMMGKWWQRLLRKEDEYAELIFENTTHLIEKSQYDAFYQTNLDEMLQKTGRKQLIICGVMTNLCCETTLRSAFVRGYECVLPIDTTAAYTRKMHEATILNLAFGFCPPMLGKEVIKQIEQ